MSSGSLSHCSRKVSAPLAKDGPRPQKKKPSVRAASVKHPDLSLWFVDEVGFGPCVLLHVWPLWGQPSRNVLLTASEARELSRLLLQASAELDEIVANAKGTGE